MNLPSLQAERARKWTEIDATPEAERQEIRGIYAAKGSSVLRSADVSRAWYADL